MRSLSDLLLPTETDENCFFKKPFKASGNWSKDKQQMKKHIFKNNFKNSLRKMSLYLNQNHCLPPSLISAQGRGISSTPDSCNQEHRAPFPPLPSRSHSEGFLPRRKRVSHPAPSCLLKGLSPEQVWLRGRCSSPSSPHWWNVYFIGCGAWRRPGPWSSQPWVRRKSKPRWPLATPSPPQNTVTQRETCHCSYPTSRDPTQSFCLREAADIKTDGS